MRLRELRLQRIAAQAGGSLFAGPGNADNLPLFGQVFANQVILGVGNNDVAVKVDAQVLGPVELRLTRVAIVACRSCPAGAGYSMDATVGIDDAQGMAAALQDVDVAFGIHGDGARINERGSSRLGAVFRDATLAVAGDRADDPGFQVQGA